MTTLSKNKPRALMLGDLEDLPVVAGGTIFEGAAVGENGAGYSRPLVAGDPFQGFAEVKADNSGGGAGDIDANIRRRGRIQLAVPGAAITVNDGDAVYAADDDTFTLTVGANSLIGYVSRWVSTGVVIVEFDAMTVKAA